MSEILSMDRREFVKLLGGGIVMFVSLGPSALLEGQERRPGYPEDFNAYLRIAEDGRVTLFSGKIEMGQGVMTSLSQMAAEELGVALNAIDIVMGDTAYCPWDMGTFGSLSTRMFGPAVRAAAAQARLVLTQMAAEKLGVPKESLTVENGEVFVINDKSRQVSYGQLAKGQQIAGTVDEKAVLRSLKEFTVMGRSPKRLDGPEKVTGQAKYAGDIRRPGMLYARILRPPAHGAALKGVDTSAAAALPGVTIVNQEGLVAVLHADPETAAKALDLVKADYDMPKAVVDSESIFDHLVKSAPAPKEPEQRGDLAAGRSLAAKTFEATYLNGYVSHAPMEPHTAVAEVSNGKATVWSSTQAPFMQREQIARAIEFRPEDVRVITPYVGGGFGGKTPGPQAIEAARLAKITGKPVQVAWSRAEEFFYDTFRPAAVVKVASGVDGSGKISLWDYQVYFAGSRGSELFYDVPHASVRVYGEWRGDHGGAHPFAVGPWRAPAANTNRFAAESQIDTMAWAAGIDPLKFRLKNTSDQRMLRVLKAAADAYGWKPRTEPSRSGRGRGLACGLDVGTYVALIADVSVDLSQGAVRVERVVCAQDMGMVVSPDGARMQMEGCIMMGLGYTFTEEIRFRGGEILDNNFDTYELPRFSWLPKIETVIVPNEDLAPQGGGEPAIIGMGAVVANAIFDATGARLYRLPMTPTRILQALKKL